MATYTQLKIKTNRVHIILNPTTIRLSPSWPTDTDTELVSNIVWQGE